MPNSALVGISGLNEDGHVLKHPQGSSNFILNETFLVMAQE